MPIDREQIETALSYLEYQFLPSGEFRRRKQANAITVECFRNTCLEDFHSEGWISDNEIKNVNIETSARVEHLIATDKFDSTVPKELFRFCFEASYKNHTTKELPKPMWRALRTEAERKLSTLQTLKQTDLFMYRAKLLTTWAMYARYYDEDIKFEGEKLTADPNTIPVGRQHT